jgi:hypothetical protein
MVGSEKGLSPMTIASEQLAALKEVASKARDAYPNVKWFTVSDLQRSRVALSVVCSEHVAAFDPTTCLELLDEVERLTALIDKSVTCVVCSATLCESETPPHCEDCILTEEHYEK